MKGVVFSSMLGGAAAYARLARFLKRPSPSFYQSLLFNFMSIERDSKGFTFHVYKLFPFATMTSRAKNYANYPSMRVTLFNTRDVLVVPPRDYQLRHLAVIPRDRIKLTQNNHCERGAL